LALDRNIKCLKVIGDSDLVVSQIKQKFSAKNERLSRYRNSVWDTVELFDAFSINVVLREKNYVADMLVVSTTTLQPCEEILHDLCKMEVFFRSFVPDNLEHRQVFNDDAQILRFLQSSREFFDFKRNFLAESMNLKVEDLPNDTHPRGFSPLERMFDRHDMYRGKPVIDQSDEAFESNLGLKNEPRMVKIGKRTTKAKRDRILDLIREFKDIFF